jgi:hypothetical protein
MHGRGPNPASRHRRPTPAICAPWFRGGSDYDFAPLFDSINVAGADLALCHAPRTLERSPVCSTPTPSSASPV